MYLSRRRAVTIDAVQGSTYESATPLGSNHPRPHLPRRIVTDVLGVPTVQLGNPVSQLVPMKACDVAVHLGSRTVFHIDGGGRASLGESETTVKLLRVSREEGDPSQML